MHLLISTCNFLLLHVIKILLYLITVSTYCQNDISIKFLRPSVKHLFKNHVFMHVSRMSSADLSTKSPAEATLFQSSFQTFSGLIL